MKDFFIRAAIAADFNLKNSGTIVESAGTAAKLTGAADIPTIVGRTVGILLGILGIVFLVLTVYAGFLYLTAQGEETNVKKAKKLLSQAVIGLILIVSAYAITNVVIDVIWTASFDARTAGDELIQTVKDLET